MNMFLYSFKKCLVAISGHSFVLDKNPVIVKDIPESINFDFGQNFEECCFKSHREFCKNVAITDLYEGFLCYPLLKNNRNLTYRILFEKALTLFNHKYFITVYCDGGIKIKVESQYKSNTVEAPFLPESIDAYPVGDILFIVKLKGAKNFIIVFSVPDLKAELSDICDEFIIDEKLTLIKKHYGISTHTETLKYTWDNGVRQTERLFETDCKNQPIKQIIPLAFLEEVRLSVGYQRFLAENLVKKHTMIKDFLGGFLFTLPPFLNDHPDTYVNISKNGAKYIKFTIKNNKIEDIIVEDFSF